MGSKESISFFYFESKEKTTIKSNQLLIVDYKAGQLANRLFQFAYFIVHAIEYNYRLINPCFEEYQHLFDATDDNQFPQGKISVTYNKSKTIDRYFKRSVSLARRNAKNKKGKFLIFNFHNIRDTYDKQYKEFDMSETAFANLVKKQVVFAKGWNYRNTGLLVKHKDLLRKIFKPKDIYSDEVRFIISKTRMDYDVIIGVHLRRGDYKNFFDGRWYYDDKIFAEKLSDIQQIFVALNKSCGFIICSNEQVDESGFSGLELITGDRQPIVDLYLLSSCDYIIGPPSTFTMWASFYGDTPLYVIRDKDKKVTINDFKVAQGVESFF